MAQSHISSGTTITVIGLGRGWLVTLWLGPGRQQYPKHPSQAQRAASMGIPPRRDTHSLPLPHSQQRQEEASAQRKTAQEAGPPPLPAPSLPPRSGSGCHFETSGAVPLRPGPQGQSTDGPRMEDTLSPQPHAQHEKPHFSQPGDPRAALGLRGHTPPHTWSSPQHSREGLFPHLV